MRIRLIITMLLLGVEPAAADPFTPKIDLAYIYLDIRPQYLGFETHALGGSLGLNFEYWGIYSINPGIEYRKQDEQSLTFFTDFQHHVVEGPARVGPFIAGGIGLGIMKEHGAWQELTELRGEVGWSVEVTTRLMVQPSFSYRAGLVDALSTGAFRQSYGGSISIDIFLGETQINEGKYWGSSAGEM
jgi:hypothetical protein